MWVTRRPNDPVAYVAYVAPVAYFAPVAYAAYVAYVTPISRDHG